MSQRHPQASRTYLWLVNFSYLRAPTWKRKKRKRNRKEEEEERRKKREKEKRKSIFIFQHVTDETAMAPKNAMHQYSQYWMTLPPSYILSTHTLSNSCKWRVKQSYWWSKPARCGGVARRRRPPSNATHAQFLHHIACKELLRFCW